MDTTTSYKDATGTIEFTLKSDLMFHYVMQKSERALKGLVCSLNGIPASMVKELIVLNPIDFNDDLQKTVMDLKLILNNNEILNIELQVYTDKYWIQRGNLTPQIAESQYWLYFFVKFQHLVDRNAVLWYNNTISCGGVLCG